MTYYRFYVFDNDNHVREPPQVFECPGDEAAVEQAVQLLNGRVIEVWDRSRLVVRLEPAALHGQISDDANGAAHAKHGRCRPSIFS